MDLSDLKQEPVLVQHVQDKPASLVKEEILENITQDGNEQLCDQGIATPALSGSVSEACSVSLGDLLNIKHEPSDMDIESTVFQYMDIHYATNQNTSMRREENTIMHDWNKSVQYNRVKEESFEDKLRGSSSGPSVCDRCFKTFRSKSGLVSHIKHMHESKSYRCKLCKKKFKGQLYLSKHTEQVHGGEDENRESYGCDKCRKLCKSARDLWQHSYRVHGTESHKCTQCNKEFKCKLYLVRHVQNTHSEKHYECDICKKIHKSRETLKRHVSYHHRGRSADAIDMTYKCDKCLRIFKSKLTLKKHHERMHGTESHRCTECNRKFKCRDYLKVHVRYAHSKQQFECATCKKVFQSKLALSGHRLQVHKPAGPRSYIYTCDYCQKTFWRKPSLRQHIEYIHGEYIHRCQECNEVFNSRHYLQQHKTKIHNKPQCECGVCHELFMSMYILTAHVKEAHGLDDIQPKSEFLSQEVHESCPVAGDTIAVVGRTKQQHHMVAVKSELTDAELELGPVVFQHMDSNYRPLKEELQLD